MKKQLIKKVMKIGRRAASRPVLDDRTPDEILGYDEMGIAQGSDPETKSSAEFVSALDLAGDLIGSIRGLPKDLATNPKYMEGYGE